MGKRGREGSEEGLVGDGTALVERAAETEAMVESAPVALLVVDEGGRITRANGEAERLFGYDRSELLGAPVERLVPERARAEHAEQRRAFAERPEKRAMGAGRDLRAQRRDGSEVAVEIGLVPLRTSRGTSVLATIADVSVRKRLEAQVRRRSHELERQTAELARSNQALEQSNLDLQQFAYLASHDLQTPLRSVSGFVQLLQQHYAGRLDERADDWIRRVVRGVDRMQGLIRDLLTYSRVDSRARPFAPTPMNEVFDDVVAQLASSIADADAEVTRSGELPVVNGDRIQLVQLLQNLIGNAIKYQGEGRPRVRVSAARSEDDTGWRFSVADNGIGVEPRYREKVFEIFRRLHAAHEYPGTGIGLAVCRRVAMRHGGRIWCGDNPDGGSTFHFTVPDEKPGDPP